MLRNAIRKLRERLFIKGFSGLILIGLNLIEAELTALAELFSSTELSAKSASSPRPSLLFAAIHEFIPFHLNAKIICKFFICGTPARRTVIIYDRLAKARRF